MVNTRSEAEQLLVDAIQSHKTALQSIEVELQRLREQASAAVERQTYRQNSIKSLQYALQVLEKSLMFYKNGNNAD